MSGFSNAVVGGVGTLVRTFIKSFNYVAGVAGWIISRDGSAEFNSAVIRGSLSAGGGNVTVNSAGIHVTGVSVQMDINSGAGFLVRANPTDGSAAQLTVLGGVGGQLSLEPAPNAANPSAVLTQVFLIAGTDLISGTDIQPYARLKTPVVNSLAVTTIQAWSQSSGSAVDNSKMLITTRSVGFSAYGATQPDLGYGEIANGVMTSNGGAVTSGAQVTQTFATNGGFAPNFTANRAYRVEVTANVATSVLTAAPVFEVHKTNPAGQRFGSWRVGPSVINFPYVLTANCYFTIGSANITGANIALTLGGAASASVNVVASADNPTTITIYDCGTAASYPNAPVLV